MISTATFAIRQEEPVQSQKSALADRQVSADEPVNRLAATSFPNEWIAGDDALEDFVDLISQYMATFNATTYRSLTTAYWPLEDEYARAVDWKALSHRQRQLSQLREEELLDWDVTIKTPSTRPSTTILASVEYRGRAKPRPVIDPWD